MLAVRAGAKRPRVSRLPRANNSVCRTPRGECAGARESACSGCHAQASPKRRTGNAIASALMCKRIRPFLLSRLTEPDLGVLEGAGKDARACTERVALVADPPFGKGGDAVTTRTREAPGPAGGSE